MSKIIIVVHILLVSVSLLGCDNNNSILNPSNKKPNNPNNVINEGTSDYQGVILEINESSVTVGTNNVDSEASYPAFEVFVDNQTKIVGIINEFSKLKVDQKVEILVKDKWNNNPNNKMIASKIIVSNK
ncbi:hypothetical protein BME96_05695 [Virgibacillus halodenitrificans]|uniref:DUF3221 domain-containing protein n=1 Tax=Virgibacillus halodenitrificans TaxID=1482 RepID=A0AAC9J0M1_VIRHA|nr:hypothetical protein [Virgibacillus halodenitrificans]APC47690.1 hypothetical protein BME96_05695 [Virgibacillus halodenitrificans]